MSGSCGNCDCADQSQCGKGNSYGLVVETVMSHVETVAMDVPAAENGGNCKCGSNCGCGSSCTCGSSCNC